MLAGGFDKAPVSAQDAAACRHAAVKLSSLVRPGDLDSPVSALQGIGKKLGIGVNVGVLGVG
jgi:hypothetical protein